MSPRRLGAGLAAVGMLAWLAWRALDPGSEPRPAVVVADSTEAGFRTARLYFAARDGAGLVAETREMRETENLRDRVVYLVAELDQGPRENGVRALPRNTGVMHVYLDEHGLMTLDLGTAFRQSFHGGSTAEYLAVASLVRTIGANAPEVRKVLLVSGGQPLASLGGHLPLDRPFEISDPR